MNRLQKQALVEEMHGKLTDAQLVVLADYTGLNVESMGQLRRKLGAVEDTELRVVKNTLCSRAIAGTELESMKKLLSGPTAWVLGFSDPVSPAKVLSDFSKENKKFKVKGGYFGGKVISSEEVKTLASLPTREVLFGQLLGTLQAPMTQLVRTLAAVPQQFVGVLAAQKDKIEKSE